MSPYREIEHTADWALLVEAPTLSELFVEAARGMYALTGARAGGMPEAAREISISAEDRESLLVAWLQELLYLLETEGLVFEKVSISALSETAMEAHVRGARSARVDKMIKAVTYNDLHIEEDRKGFRATLVFDV